MVWGACISPLNQEPRINILAIKNLQKQPPTALKAGIAKFTVSVGGKLESWYFDFATSTGWAIIDYPDDVAAAPVPGYRWADRSVRRDKAVVVPPKVLEMIG
jgi:hypothetical protein